MWRIFKQLFERFLTVTVETLSERKYTLYNKGTLKPTLDKRIEEKGLGIA